MLDNGNRKCEFADVIVSYIYDEIDEVERTGFENHLAGCVPCMDDLAGVSNARLSMFEWRKEEFAHLATPKFVIPYTERPQLDNETKSIGFFDGLLGWLSPAKIPIAVAASLAVVVGIGYFSIDNLKSSGQQIAANNIVNEQVVPPAVPDSTIVSVGPVNIPSKTEAISPRRRAVSTNVPIDEIGSTRVARPNKQVTADARRTVDGPDKRNTPRLQKAPVLSLYDDSDDKSLRLADLFDDFGDGV